MLTICMQDCRKVRKCRVVQGFFSTFLLYHRAPLSKIELPLKGEKMRFHSSADNGVGAPKSNC